MDALARLGADEGRGKLRKASGSCKQALIRGYPNGKPAWDNTQASIPEHIGYGGGTGELETSKYPEEEKTTVIP